MGKLLYFWQGHPKSAFSKKVQSGNQGKFFKNRQKSSPRFKRPQSTLAKMALSSNLNAVKVQRLQKILAQKAAPKSTLITKLCQFSQGHPKPTFSEKVQREDQGKFLKNRRKSSFRFKRLKALAQVALSSN